MNEKPELTAADMEPRVVDTVSTSAGDVSIIERIVSTERETLKPEIAAALEAEGLAWEDVPRDAWTVVRDPVAVKPAGLAAIERALEPKGKLAKAARKVGLPAPTIRVVHRFTVQEVVTRWCSIEGRPVPVLDQDRKVVRRPSPRFYVAVTAPERVAIPGWTFLARLRHEPGGTLVDALGQEPGLQAAWKRAEPNCDHCAKQRRRKDTYLVRNEDGQVRQVGRQCLRDYCGHQSPAAVATFAALAADLSREIAVSAGGDFEDAEGGCSRRSNVADLSGFLTQVAAIVMIDGYIKSDGPGEPTGDTAWTMLFGRRPEYPEARREWDRRLPVNVEGSHELAARTVTWLEGLVARDDAGEDLGDYLGKLAIIARGGAVFPRSSRLAASAVTSYRREVERRETRKARERVGAESEWVGKPKQRLVLDLTPISVRECESYYGVSYLYRFSDDDGNMLVWFASRRQRELEDKDRDNGLVERVSLKATVKKHDEYKGVKQTVLSRGAVQS